MYTNTRSIAILLAAYNAEKFIKQQIESLLHQSNQNWTLYIRNDDSTDSTGSIINDYCLKYKNKIIEIDKNGKNLGCRGNFFRLLECVKSDYYMCCDADDIWLPEKISISYEVLKSKEEIHKGLPLLVHTDKVVCNEKMNIITASWWKAVKLNPDLFLKFKYIPISPVIGGATMLFNREVRERCLPIPKNPPQHDCWIPMIASKYGKIFSIHIPLILYRQHSNNMIGAPVSPYRFSLKKITHTISILKRDYKYVKYLNTLGYDKNLLSYTYYRIIVLIKLQWSKLTYK